MLRRWWHVGGFLLAFLVGNGHGCLVTAEEPEVSQQVVEKVAEIESLLSGLVSEEGPGVALRVSVGDAVLIDKGYGLADLAHDVPVTPKTKFRIGSVTKNITAAAILKLQEEGKLDVSKPVSSVLPDFPNGDKVTIEQLLNHTSGIPSYTSGLEFFETVQLEISPEELVDSFKDQPLEFEPGSKFSYNNSGYFLLGHIVAKLSGLSYDSYLRKTFFKPLGMTNTGVHTAKVILEDEAYGYSFTGAGYEKALNWDMSRAGGAGALYSTTVDMDVWVRAFYGGKVLKQESVRGALTANVIAASDDGEPEDTRYGYGWFIDDQRGLDRISHGGGLQGFSSHLAYYPELDLSIVVLHNALPSAPAITPAKISDQVAEILFGDKMDPIPEFEIDETVTPEMMKAFVGRYDYKTAVMDVTLEDGQLYAHLTAQPRHAIYPAGPSKFFWKVVDAQVEFVKDDSGKVVAAKHTQNGTTFRVDRLPDDKPLELSDEVLDRHVGRYRIKQLGEMIVEKEESHLTAKLASQPSLQIFGRSETEFYYTIVPAEIVFGELKDGKSQKITLKQAGVSFEGVRVDGDR